MLQEIIHHLSIVGVVANEAVQWREFSAKLVGE
jgi:hypothetical protein